MKRVIILWIITILGVISGIILLGYKFIHGDFNLDTTTMAALAFTSSGALFMSVGAFLKQYYDKITGFISNRIGYSIVVHDSINGTEFDILASWVNSLDKLVIKNNRTFLRSSNEGATKIGYGDYCIMLDTLTICWISLAQHDSKSDPFDTLSIKIMGLRKNKHVQLIESKLKTLHESHKNDLYIETPAQNFWVAKKNGDVLAGDYFKTLVASVDKWNDMKDYYKHYGITHKLGILLYGKPGTGKSTLAKALASHFDYYLYVLTPLELNNSVLYDIMHTTRPIIVLFEDIDCIVTGRETKDNKPVETGNTKLMDNCILQQLLNLLDGVSSPDNIIFIATTNYVERLDSALTRAGRFDISLEVKELNKNEAIDMCRIFNVDPEKYLLNQAFPINQSKLQAEILTDTVKNKLL